MVLFSCIYRVKSTSHILPLMQTKNTYISFINMLPVKKVIRATYDEERERERERERESKKEGLQQSVISIVIILMLQLPRLKNDDDEACDAPTKIDKQRQRKTCMFAYTRAL